ncbi:MAG TPA: YtxH domain-containing protein [Chloroflexia bacterium]|jgi:gas vesicle protein|nr:YtxH domain-containing protein [Chloroflexia bacterium]
MLRMVRTALKYATLGLLAGVILAPRKGEETRKLVADRAKQLLHEVAAGDKVAPASGT